MKYEHFILYDCLHYKEAYNVYETVINHCTIRIFTQLLT